MFALYDFPFYQLQETINPMNSKILKCVYILAVMIIIVISPDKLDLLLDNSQPILVPTAEELEKMDNN